MQGGYNHQFVPLNLAGPSNKSVELSEDLVQCLVEEKQYETAVQRASRTSALQELQSILRDWSQKLQQVDGFCRIDFECCRPIALIFGSVALGVQAPGADIDILLLAPAIFDRGSEFFGDREWSMQNFLAGHHSVEYVIAVPEGHIPILKIKLGGVSLDLLFASLPLPKLPTNPIDLASPALQGAMSEQCIYSLAGYLNTRLILHTLQANSPSQFPHVQVALKFIKLWAKRRGVYANVLGYLGGVNFALLLAKLVLLYPNLDAAQLVVTFFEFYAGYDWTLPVALLPVQPDALRLEQWSTSDPLDTNLMPLITAGYPAQNSTYNVSEQTLRVQKQELARGAALARNGEWRAICKPYDFFGLFPAYLVVDLEAAEKVALLRLKGYATPLYRKLLDGLEEILEVRPWPDEHVFYVSEDNTWRCHVYAGLQNSKTPGTREYHVGGLVTWFTCEVMGWKGRTGDMAVRVAQLAPGHLPDELRPDGVEPIPWTRPPAAQPPDAQASEPSHDPSSGADTCTPRVADAIATCLPSAQPKAPDAPLDGEDSKLAVKVEQMLAGDMCCLRFLAGMGNGEETAGMPGNWGQRGQDQPCAGQEKQRQQQQQQQQQQHNPEPVLSQMSSQLVQSQFQLSQKQQQQGQQQTLGSKLSLVQGTDPPCGLVPIEACTPANEAKCGTVQTHVTPPSNGQPALSQTLLAVAASNPPQTSAHVPFAPTQQPQLPSSNPPDVYSLLLQLAPDDLAECERLVNSTSAPQAGPTQEKQTLQVTETQAQLREPSPEPSPTRAERPSPEPSAADLPTTGRERSQEQAELPDPSFGVVTCIPHNADLSVKLGAKRSGALTPGVRLVDEARLGVAPSIAARLSSVQHAGNAAVLRSGFAPDGAEHVDDDVEQRERFASREVEEDAYDGELFDYDAEDGNAHEAIKVDDQDAVEDEPPDARRSSAAVRLRQALPLGQGPGESLSGRLGSRDQGTHARRRTKLQGTGEDAGRSELGAGRAGTGYGAEPGGGRSGGVRVREAGKWGVGGYRQEKEGLAGGKLAVKQKPGWTLSLIQSSIASNERLDRRPGDRGGS